MENDASRQEGSWNGYVEWRPFEFQKEQLCQHRLGVAKLEFDAFGTDGRSPNDNIELLQQRFRPIFLGGKINGIGNHAFGRINNVLHFGGASF
jgi:hypothetical protein